VVAILFGLVLLAVEIFVLPGHLLPGILGIALVLGGLVLTFVGTEPSMPGVLPAMHGTWVALQRGLITVAAGLVASLLLWIWLSKYLPSLPYFNKLILTNVTGAGVEIASVGSPQETGPAIGDVGVAVSELKPGGSVKFITESYPDGRIAAVVSDSGYVPPGTSVIVREVAGNRVVVRPQA
jgi:membrane-bound serine protease (ClpP class)